MDRLGDYRLRKKLAAGGMGEVYLGEKVGPEGFLKPVVLKCVLPQLAKDRGFVQLFLDEARLAALLNHPNIAQVYDFGVVEGTYYIAMEYVPGYTFEDIRRKLASLGQRMPLQHIAHAASQACQGLHYAHTLTDGHGESLGLVHRDVSPHNLIVSVDGTVKLVDFGIAKARAGLTRVRAKGAVGKHGYASPEQSRGEPVDGRSDLFSLGVCLWELTTNERLWPPNLDRAPDYAEAPIRGVDTIRPEVPRQFLHILETALAVDREARFASARDMHLALERFQAAMTHYAGQAALAQFIADLVGARSGEPGAQASPRETAAETPSANALDRSAASTSAPTSSSRRMPASWDGVPDARRRVGGTKEVEFEDSGFVPELARTLPNRARPTPPPMPRRRGRSATRWLFTAIGACALIAAGYAFRAPLAEWVGRLRAARSPAAAGPVASSSRTRIESVPPGARVRIDGRELEHRTPLEVELMPEAEHLVEVELEGRATVARRVVGKISVEPTLLRFELEPAATLDVRSSPPGATVWVEGREIAEPTPVVVPAVPAGRTIRVRVQRSQGASVVREVRAEPGTTAQLEFELDALDAQPSTE